MTLIGSASRVRHEFIDTVIQQNADNLRDNDGVRRLLDETTRLGLLQTVEGLYVPNVRHGVVSVPKEYQGTDNSPIVALRRGEDLVFGDGFGQMTPAQSKNFLTFLRAYGLDDYQVSRAQRYIESELKNKEGVGTLTRGGIKDTTLAFVCRLEAGLMLGSLEAPPSKDPSSGRWIIGRPIIALLAKQSGQFLQLPSETGALVHELVHDFQDKTRPAIPAEKTAMRADYVERELEAYHYAAYYEWGLFRSSDPRYADNPEILNNAKMEATRREYIPDESTEPFRAPAALMDVLTNLGVITPSSNSVR